VTPESLVRSGVAGAVAVGGTLLFAPAAIVLGTLHGPGDPRVSWCYRAFARLAMGGCDARLATNGDDHLDRRRRYVFVSNHQSNLDPMAILASLPHQTVRFVAKSQLRSIPLLGYALATTGNVFVERSDTSRDVRSLDAQRALLRKVSVLFFAEGSRGDGPEVGPFKKGAAVFAIKNRLPLVPIGVHGAFEILPPGNLVMRGGTIGVAVGDPIDVKPFSLEDRERLTAELRNAVLRQVEVARVLAEGSA
jgi:1-acyl-sn-glycerol-3-phosphate acyltransferase